MFLITILVIYKVTKRGYKDVEYAKYMGKKIRRPYVEQIATVMDVACGERPVIFCHFGSPRALTKIQVEQSVINDISAVIQEHRINHGEPACQVKLFMAPEYGAFFVSAPDRTEIFNVGNVANVARSSCTTKFKEIENHIAKMRAAAILSMMTFLLFVMFASSYAFLFGIITIILLTANQPYRYIGKSSKWVKVNTAETKKDDAKIDMEVSSEYYSWSSNGKFIYGLYEKYGVTYESKESSDKNTIERPVYIGKYTGSAITVLTSNAKDKDVIMSSKTFNYKGYIIAVIYSGETVVNGIKYSGSAAVLGFTQTEINDKSGNGIYEIPREASSENETYIITEIASNAFKNITLLEQLFLPDTLEVIREGAFQDCFELTGELYIPDSVVHIEDWAFSSTNLNDVYMSEQLAKDISENVFSGCEAIDIHLINEKQDEDREDIESNNETEQSKENTNESEEHDESEERLIDDAKDDDLESKNKHNEPEPELVEETASEGADEEEQKTEENTDQIDLTGEIEEDERDASEFVADLFGDEEIGFNPGDDFMIGSEEEYKIDDADQNEEIKPDAKPRVAKTRRRRRRRKTSKTESVVRSDG